MVAVQIMPARNSKKQKSSKKIAAFKALEHAYRAGRFSFRLQFRESAPVGAKNVLCLTVRVRIVVAGAGGSVQTVWVRRFTGMISSFLFRLSESESETESACTIRVTLNGKRNSLNMNQRVLNDAKWLSLDETYTVFLLVSCDNFNI